MDQRPPDPVYLTPVFALPHGRGGDVTLILPTGETVALSRTAALQSARQILSVANASLEGDVQPMHPAERRRPIRIRWQGLRLRVRGAMGGPAASTRLLVAAILLPVVWAMIAVPALAAVLYLHRIAAAFIVLGLATIVAPVIAWTIAPRLMSREELRPQQRPFRPTFVP